MVQMKGWYKAHLRKFKIKLYIPHGSDESCNRYIYYLTVIMTLYPTWFR